MAAIVGATLLLNTAMGDDITPKTNKKTLVRVDGMVAEVDNAVVVL